MDLSVDINFDLASQKWRANKFRPRGSQSWRYYDNRHKQYLTRPMKYLAHTPRCSHINDETGQKCGKKSYFTRQQRESEELGVLIQNMDVDVLDGIYCWLHKKYEKKDTEYQDSKHKSSKLIKHINSSTHHLSLRD
jgi:hypothetical protein